MRRHTLTGRVSRRTVDNEDQYSEAPETVQEEQGDVSDDTGSGDGNERRAATKIRRKLSDLTAESVPRRKENVSLRVARTKRGGNARQAATGDQPDENEAENDAEMLRLANRTRQTIPPVRKMLTSLPIQQRPLQSQLRHGQQPPSSPPARKRTRPTHDEEVRDENDDDDDDDDAALGNDSGATLHKRRKPSRSRSADAAGANGNGEDAPRMSQNEDVGQENEAKKNNKQKPPKNDTNTRGTPTRSRSSDNTTATATATFSFPNERNQGGRQLQRPQHVAGQQKSTVAANRSAAAAAAQLTKKKRARSESSERRSESSERDVSGGTGRGRKGVGGNGSVSDSSVTNNDRGDSGGGSSNVNSEADENEDDGGDGDGDDEVDANRRNVFVNKRHRVRSRSASGSSSGSDTGDSVGQAMVGGVVRGAGRSKVRNAARRRRVQEADQHDIAEFMGEQMMSNDIEADLTGDESPAQLVQLLLEWKRLWVTETPRNEVQRFRHDRTLFGAETDDDELANAQLKPVYHSIVARIVNLTEALKRHHLIEAEPTASPGDGAAAAVPLDSEAARRAELYTITNKVNEAVGNAFFSILNNGKNTHNGDSRAAAELPVELNCWTYVPPQSDDMKTMMRLLVGMLQKAREFGFRRMGAKVFEAVYTKKMQYTRHWRPIMSMKEFVYFAICPYDHNKELAAYLFDRKGNDTAVAEWLVNLQHETRFPILKPDRRIVAFDNCILNVKENRTYSFEHPALSASMVAGQYIALPYLVNLYHRQSRRCVCKKKERLRRERQEAINGALNGANTNANANANSLSLTTNVPANVAAAAAVSAATTADTGTEKEVEIAPEDEWKYDVHMALDHSSDEDDDDDRVTSHHPVEDETWEDLYDKEATTFEAEKKKATDTQERRKQRRERRTLRAEKRAQGGHAAAGKQEPDSDTTDEEEEERKKNKVAEAVAAAANGSIAAATARQKGGAGGGAGARSKRKRLADDSEMENDSAANANHISRSRAQKPRVRAPEKVTAAAVVNATKTVTIEEATEEDKEEDEAATTGKKPPHTNDRERKAWNGRENKRENDGDVEDADERELKGDPKRGGRRVDDVAGVSGGGRGGGGERRHGRGFVAGATPHIRDAVAGAGISVAGAGVGVGVAGDDNDDGFVAGVRDTDANEEARDNSKRAHRRELNGIADVFVSKLKKLCVGCGEHYMRVRTMSFLKIFQTQRLLGIDVEWIRAFMGRMFFDVKEMENWQVFFILIGLAGTGKSTLMNVLRAFFEQSQIGMFDERVEERFPLMGVYKAAVILAFDIGRKFNMTQGVLQQVIVGESVEVFIKGKEPVSIANWKAPMWWCCNVYPHFVSSGGAMVRRIVSTNFPYVVEKSDPELDKKIGEELPAIIYSCVNAFHAKLRDHKRQNIWDVLPQSFKDQQTKTAINTNPLEGFLRNSERVHITPDGVYPWHEFKKDYRSSAREEGILDIPLLIDSFYNVSFKRHDIQLKETGYFVNAIDGEPLNGPHLLGVKPSVQQIELKRQRLAGGGGGGQNYRNQAANNANNANQNAVAGAQPIPAH
jgi:hypothetical protein